MKKVSALAVASLLLFFGCSKSVSDKHNLEEVVEQPPAGGRQCASYEVLQAKLKEDPSLQKRMDEIEAFTARYAAQNVNGKLEADGITMTIPVYVNVLYNTAAQSISDEQIASQIAVLNEDFADTNGDVNSTGTYQSAKAGTTNIKFVLAGVIRKSTSVTSWSTNDAMKKSSQGGIEPTSPSTALNMWSCNLGSYLGYAQFPGGSSSTDGVVILYSAFGSRAKYAQGTYTITYDLGRTATHEVGNWLNLRHIWGDRRCGDDLVSDTPGHDGANYGCPAANTTSKCSGRPIEMTMNYMDYTDDRCMYMFTAGQETRMRATFAANGPRASLRP